MILLTPSLNQIKLLIMEKIDLPLKQLTLAQKLSLMEELWDDLTKDENEFESPGWHEDVLKDREKAFEEGKIKISDWEEAKARIRKRLSNDS